MGLFSSKKEGGMMDMIRCDEQEFLIWKWRPEGNEVNSTNKENAIRWKQFARKRWRSGRFCLQAKNRCNARFY